MRRVRFGESYRPRWYHLGIARCQTAGRHSVIRITESGKTGHTKIHTQRAKLDHPVMNEFGVLTNRKRALIALAHSLVFLGIASHGFVSPKAAAVFQGPGATLSIALIVIYFTVASILAWLVSISRCARERLYFVLCASSASFGLLRTIFGDAALPAVQYLRVVALTSAVMVGAWIFRSFSRSVPESL